MGKETAGRNPEKAAKGILSNSMERLMKKFEEAGIPGDKVTEAIVKLEKDSAPDVEGAKAEIKKVDDLEQQTVAAAKQGMDQAKQMPEKKGFFGRMRDFLKFDTLKNLFKTTKDTTVEGKVMAATGAAQAGLGDVGTAAGFASVAVGAGAAIWATVKGTGAIGLLGYTAPVAMAAGAALMATGILMKLQGRIRMQSARGF